VTMSSYPYLDMGNDEKEGDMTEISKQPWCDHRDLMNKRADIFVKSRQFLAIKCDHRDDRKKVAHKAFLTRKQCGLSQ
jgi:hypothetical protein